MDVGVLADLPSKPGLVSRKVRPGTADMTTGPAMTRAEAESAVEAGIDIATELAATGFRCLVTGDMGIANTTPAAALIAAFTGSLPADVTGRGTGIDDRTWARKVDAVGRALALHKPDPADPLGVLARSAASSTLRSLDSCLARPRSEYPLCSTGSLHAQRHLRPPPLRPTAYTPWWQGTCPPNRVPRSQSKRWG